MKRRSFFGALAGLFALPFAAKAAPEWVSLGFKFKPPVTEGSFTPIYTSRDTMEKLEEVLYDRKPQEPYGIEYWKERAEARGLDWDDMTSSCHQERSPFMD